MRLSLVLTITFILGTLSQSVFALPGDAREELIQRGCGQNGEGPMGAAAFNIGNLIQCQGFTEDQVAQMCECMEKTYGDSIKEDDSYQAFSEGLMSFDTSDTAMVEFTQDVTSMEMATLANFIAEQDPEIADPFSSGGVCATKLEAFQNQVNAEVGLDFDFTPINGLMRSHRDPDYLAAKGVDVQYLNESLTNFWRTINSPVGNVLVQRYDGEQNNPIIRHLYNSVFSSVEGPSTHDRLTSQVPQGETLPQFMALSKEDAVDTLCNGLIARFRDMREENEFNKIGYGIIDRENLLTDRNLHDSDVNAFRGLRTRYLNTNDQNSVRDELYFNQRFCENYNPEESSGKVERPTDPEITGATDQQLRELIITNNAYFEGSSEQIEAGNAQLDEFMDERDEVTDELKTLLEEAGLNWDDFKNRLLYLEAESDPVSAFQEILVGIRPEGLSVEHEAPIWRLVSEYHISNQHVQEVSETLRVLHEPYGSAQYRYNDAAKELLHRKGNMIAVRDFLGEENVLSRTAQFYSSLDRDLNGDYIGPRLPVHAHIGNDENLVGPDILRRTAEVVDRKRMALEVSDELIEDGDTETDPELRDLRKQARDALVGNVFTERRSGGTRSATRGRSNRQKGRLLSFSNTSGGFNGDSANKGNGQGFSGRSPANIIDRKVNGATGEVSRTTPSPFKPLGSASNTGDNLVGSQFYARQGLANPGATSQPPKIPAQNAADSSLSTLERRLRDLDRLESERLERVARDEDREDGKGPEENVLLRDELSRLRGELSSLRQKSNELAARQEKVRNENRINAPIVPTPVAAATPVTTDGGASSPFTRGQTIGRTAGSTGVVSEVAPTQSTPTNAPPVARVESAPVIEVPFSPSSSLRAPSTSGDRSRASASLGNFEGVSLTLVSGSAGFAEVNGNDLTAAPVDIGLDFLSLPDSDKVQFIEEFFRERSGETAVVRQNDGRVVLIERNSDFRAAESSEFAGLDEEEILRNQAAIVHRVRTMNTTLDRILEE